MSFLGSLFSGIMNILLTVILLPVFLALFVVNLIRALLWAIFSPVRKWIRDRKKQKENYYRGY